MLSTESKDGAMGGGTILVVDDHEEVCNVFRRILERDGYRVLRATTGRSALATLRRRPVQLILLDLKMPGLDGISVLGRIRKINPAQRVVILTGHGHIDTARQAMQMGAYDYITKPFNVAFVKGIIREALSGG
jgi:DNA-binding NtrC family response regulator